MGDKIIRWSNRASDHFEEICEYISQDSSYYASLFAKRIIDIVKKIPEFPKSGRIVPEYSNENLREKIYSNYRIVYRINNDIIEIVDICHSAQQLKDLF